MGWLASILTSGPARKALGLLLVAAGLLGSLIPYELPGSAFHLLIAFSLAFLHIWLFLTAALLLLRLGRTLIPPDPRPTA